MEVNSRLSAALQAKLELMRNLLRGMGRIVVAFSGGVDSTFVLKVSLETLGRENVVAATGRSASLADGELRDVMMIVNQLNAPHVVIDTSEIEHPRYRENPIDRCYYCKQELYQHLSRYANSNGYSCVVSGTNTDDLGDWRPGLKAAQEFAVRAPAQEAGMCKEDIRMLSRKMNLPTWQKPATPCLASRVPYGTTITVGMLKQIEVAERALRSLGFSEFRVRHHDRVARIELTQGEFSKLHNEVTRQQIDEAIRAAGYEFVAVDLKPFKSGSLNTHLGPNKRETAGDK